jgi:hypothetical protein
LVALSLFAPFVATLQGALLFGAVALGVIGWIYSTEAWAAINQRRWNAHLNLPLVAITLVVCFGAMLALDGMTAPNERDGARRLAGARRPEIVPVLPARIAPPNPQDSAPGGAAGAGESPLFAPSTTGDLTDAEVSMKAVELSRQLFAAQPRPGNTHRGPSADSSYESTLKPAEAQIRRELERRIGVPPANAPHSCQIADSQRLSGPHPLSQHASCLLDLAKMLDQAAQ